MADTDVDVTAYLIELTGALPAAAAGAAGGLGVSTAGIDFDNLPTTTEFDARTLPSADYFIVSDYTAPPSASTISTQVASDLATAHGAGSWLTATGFATPTNVTDAVSAIETFGGLGPWTGASLVDILAGITSDHGSGSYVRNTEPDNTGIDDLQTKIDAALAAGGGTGAYTVTITVQSSSDSSAIEGARVRLTSGVDTVVGSTNASGVIAFSRDAATWSVVITKAGYSFTPTTLVVSANTTHTYQMTPQVVTPAALPSQATGTLVCYDESGVAEASVSIYLQQIAAPEGHGSAFDTAIRTLTSDGSGIVTATGLWRGGRYNAWRGTSIVKVPFTVPEAASFNLPAVLGTP